MQGGPSDASETMEESKRSKRDEINFKISCLFKARYPILYVVSSEEARVEENLKRVADPLELKVYRWSITEGIRDLKGNPREAIKDPLGALNFVDDVKEDCVLVLRDFHPFFKDLTIVRRIRDLYASLPKTVPGQAHFKRHVVILSPVQNMPPELVNEITVLDYPLPESDEVQEVLDRLESMVARRRKGYASLDDDTRLQVVEAALGLTKAEAESVLARTVVETKRFDVETILSEKEQIIRRGGTLEYFHPREGFSDIGGLENLKTWLMKRKLAFSPRAQAFGLPRPKGILLLGVPGCGKSLTAKAIGSYWKQPLLRLDVGRVFSSYVGSSEENMRAAIKMAESVAPSILWVDELEKGFSGTASSGQTDGGTTSRVFGSFITWLQEKTSPVFVIATANDVSSLPPELLRKGRFDEIFFVDLPTMKERTDILGIHLQRRGYDPHRFNIPRMAEQSDGFSGSELEQAIISALYDAFDAGEGLTPDRIFNAFEETVTLARTMKENINQMREWARVRARSASGGGFRPPQGLLEGGERSPDVADGGAPQSPSDDSRVSDVAERAIDL